MDKGYYDYDYSEYEKKEGRKLVTVEESAKSDAEVCNALAAFGWGRKKEAQEPLMAGELQELVIKDINERKGEGSFKTT